MELSKFKGLNSNQLKIIAIIAMTVDHLAWVFMPGYPTEPSAIILHLIGRLTAPIMWYFVAEGYHYTRNLKKYIIRLFAFAIVSHFAYNFCFDISFIPFKDSILDQTSVIWTLAWGLVALAVTESKNPKLKEWMKYVIVMLICVISLCADWSCIGVMAIVAIGTNRNNFKKQMISMMVWVAVYAVIYFLFIDKVYGILQLGVALSIPVLKLYNGQRGKWKGMKWFFYFYYPVHLVICGLIRILIYK